MKIFRKQLVLFSTFLGVLAFFLVPAKGLAKNLAPEDRNQTVIVSLDKVLARHLANGNIVGTVVAVSRNGELVYHRAAGYADRERKMPMAENSIFRLSSVTKAYTTMAAAVLIGQGKMTLDDPVTRWLPDFTPALPDGRTPVMTIRHLLSHTSGLDYGFQDTPGAPYPMAGVSDGLNMAGITLEENLKRMVSVPLLFEPGTRWHYSLSTDVLGAVIASVNRSTLPEAMDQLVLAPLKISNTGFVVKNPARLVTPYIRENGRLRPMAENEVFPTGAESAAVIHFTPGRALDASAYPSGGAGLNGTGADLMKLLECLQRNGSPLVSKKTMQEFTKNQLKKIWPALARVLPLDWAGPMLRMRLLQDCPYRTERFVGVVFMGIHGMWTLQGSFPSLS